MTIQEFLEWMDGNGIIVTDLELVNETLENAGYFLNNQIDLDVDPYPDDRDMS